MSMYDTFADQYDSMVKRGGPRNAHNTIIEQLQMETVLSGKRICDVGCGQGELAKKLSDAGAIVTGVDSSKRLLAYAQQLTDMVHWTFGDAMNLSCFGDESFDIVVSSLMLMDVPDHRAAFRESYRVLKPDGIIVWLIMHPCFHSPFCNLLEDGTRHVSHYTPQYWKSLGHGTLRSIVGSYHRPVADYVNDFMSTGFQLKRILEPILASHAGTHPKTPDLPHYFGAVGRKPAAR